MNRRRSFVGLTTLVVMVITLFMVVFSSLAYLNSDGYSKRTLRRIEVRQQQYISENAMIEQVYEISEFYNGDNINDLMENYNLEKEGQHYTGQIAYGDYQVIYKLLIDNDKVILDNYYIQNISEQNYGEQKFDF